jgi:hypothetical protein
MTGVKRVAAVVGNKRREEFWTERERKKKERRRRRARETRIQIRIEEQ